MSTRQIQIVLFLSLLICSKDALALEGLVEKKEFSVAQYETVSGKTISGLRVGYESYGQLNASKDNVILITHYYSGTSHAAGKYTESDETSGYWDSIIGPGKPLDTSRYFVISSDTLVNVNAKDPRTITTGPATLDPATGKPYALNFPKVTLRDFVRVQKLLLDSLEIKGLTAVIGASSGAMQAMQWAAEYPDFVKKAVAVIGPGLKMPVYSVELLNLWSMPIRLDSAWNQGDYYGRTEPTEGLTQAMKFVTHSAMDFSTTEAKYGADNIDAGFEKAAKARAAKSDANSFIYMGRAIQTFNVEDQVPKIKAKLLFISAESDMIFPPHLAQDAVRKLRKASKSADLLVLKGAGGHLAGITGITEASGVLARFLKATK